MVVRTSLDLSNCRTAAPNLGVRDTARTLKLHYGRRAPDRATLAMAARLVLQERRRRAELFGKAMFGEPAWDMLLHLYTAPGMMLTVGKLVELVDEPKTTLLRWAAYLEEKRLVARRNDVKDRRLVWMELADRGRELLDVYFGPLDNRIAASTTSVGLTALGGAENERECQSK